jgi:hypothetical protein
VQSARKRDQHYIDHARVKVLRPSVEGPRVVSVLADYNSSSGGLVDSHGRRVTSTKAKRHVRWLFDVQRSGSRWLISSIESIS